VSADDLVDLGVPAAGPDRLGLLGSPRVRMIAGPAAWRSWCMRGVSTMIASSTIITVRSSGRSRPATTAWENASTV
jgi:hypothetical protein